jgi:hypothetical protein
MRFLVICSLAIIAIIGGLFLFHKEGLVKEGGLKLYADDLYNFSLDIPASIEPSETNFNGAVNISFTLSTSSEETKSFNIHIITPDWARVFPGRSYGCGYFQEPGDTLSRQMINGIPFVRDDVSSHHRGVASSASIVSYCVEKDGFVYDLAPTITSSGRPSDVSTDQALNHVLSTFRFLRTKLGDSGFYKDSSHVWQMGGNGKLSLISGADASTFVLVTGDPLVTARDKDHTYGFDTKGYLVVDGKSTSPLYR